MVFGCYADADDGYGADAARVLVEGYTAFGVLRWRDMEAAYTTPSPNIKLNITFLFIAICNPQRTGIGRITIATSSSKLTMPMYRSSAF